MGLCSSASSGLTAAQETAFMETAVRLANTISALGVTLDETRAVYKAFVQLDFSGNGHLDRHGFVQALHGVNPYVADRLFEVFDGMEGKYKLTFESFLVSCWNYLLDDEASLVNLTWDLIDANVNGVLRRSDIILFINEGIHKDNVLLQDNTWKRFAPAFEEAVAAQGVVSPKESKANIETTRQRAEASLAAAASPARGSTVGLSQGAFTRTLQSNRFLLKQVMSVRLALQEAFVGRRFWKAATRNRRLTPGAKPSPKHAVTYGVRVKGLPRTRPAGDITAEAKLDPTRSFRGIDAWKAESPGGAISKRRRRSIVGDDGDSGPTGVEALVYGTLYDRRAARAAALAEKAARAARAKEEEEARRRAASEAEGEAGEAGAGEPRERDRSKGVRRRHSYSEVEASSSRLIGEAADDAATGGAARAKERRRRSLAVAPSLGSPVSEARNVRGLVILSPITAQSGGAPTPKSATRASSSKYLASPAAGGANGDDPGTQLPPLTNVVSQRGRRKSGTPTVFTFSSDAVDEAPPTGEATPQPAQTQAQSDAARELEEAYFAAIVSEDAHSAATSSAAAARRRSTGGPLVADKTRRDRRRSLGAVTPKASRTLGSRTPGSRTASGARMSSRRRSSQGGAGTPGGDGGRRRMRRRSTGGKP